MNDIRYCRICWNTQEWQHPTGEAALLEGTGYVLDHGFGHEEWLFNHGWIIDGYKYRFLQPLQYISHKARSNIFDIILYTISESGERFFVGRIANCELSTNEVAAKVYNSYIQKGWLGEMVQDLKRLNIDPSPINATTINPISITNFRFKPENVDLLKPFVLANNTHKIYRVNRYRPMLGAYQDEWTKIKSKQEESLSNDATFYPGKMKSTEIQNRTAQEGTAFEPIHNQIQNALFEKLVTLYGNDNVGYEERFENRTAVDIVVRQGADIFYYEIKTATTAKYCIRLALGQLLEYSHWTNHERAKKLVVVGPVFLPQDAKKYLEYLRERYALPIYYCYYDLSNNKLSPEL